MKTQRPPAAVRREVRQRVGFGCVMCGSPIFDYEHILGYAQTLDDPDQITLLCPSHHREKTARRLPIKAVQAANANPRNLRRRYSARHPLYFSDPISLHLGNIGTEAGGEGRMVGISVDGDNLFGVRGGDDFGLSMDLRDENDVVMLLIKNGEILLSNELWDVTFEGQHLVVRDALRSIRLDLELEVPHTVIVHRADVWLHHIHFLIGDAAPMGGVSLPANQNEFSNFSIEGGVIAVGKGTPGFAVFQLAIIRGYGAPAVPVGSAFRKPEAY